MDAAFHKKVLAFIEYYDDVDKIIENDYKYTYKLVYLKETNIRTYNIESVIIRPNRSLYNSIVSFLIIEFIFLIFYTFAHLKCRFFKYVNYK